MDLGEFKRYLADRYEIVANLKIITREFEISPTINFVQSLIGPRRVGKTYLLYEFMRKSNNVLYLNFDDIELSGTTARDILRYLSYYTEIFGKEPTYIMLDEVQNILGWERVIRELHEMKRYYIFITGSSSKLLSREIATSLRGRSIPFSIYPLSFREYLKFKNVEVPTLISSIQESKMKNHLSKYMRGAFPDAVIEPMMANRFYEEYASLVIFRDIMDRHAIKNSTLLKFIFKSAISSTSKEFSIHKLYKTLKSQGIEVSKMTLYQYMNHFQDAMIFYLIKKYYPSERQRSLSIPKIYLVDSGIAYHLGVRDTGRLMENVVFTELMRRFGPENIFYWKNGGEVDFVILSDGRIFQAIQVTYELHYHNWKREIKPLVELYNKEGCQNLMMITWDQDEVINEENIKISVVPLWKWLLKLNNQ